MTQYGIKLLWAGWKDDNVIGFSHRGYMRWRDAIKPGTRMLLYETSNKRPGTTSKGTMSIIGEVEVSGSFEDGETYRAPTEQHDHLVPAKILRPRREGKRVPLDRIRELINDGSWPRQGETWTPLNREVYDRVCAELEK